MLPINFINALPSTQSISAETLQTTTSIKEKKKPHQNLYFAAIISDTPATIYRWTEQLSGTVSATITLAFSQV